MSLNILLLSLALQVRALPSVSIPFNSKKRAVWYSPTQLRSRFSPLHLLLARSTPQPESYLDITDNNMGILHQSIRAYEPYFAAAGDDECLSLSSPAWKQQATTFTFVVALLLSFAIGSVTVLVAALLWHSELVMETTVSAHSSVVECPLIRLGVALHGRRRAAVRQCWATM